MITYIYIYTHVYVYIYIYICDYHRSMNFAGPLGCHANVDIKIRNYICKLSCCVCSTLNCNSVMLAGSLIFHRTDRKRLYRYWLYRGGVYIVNFYLPEGVVYLIEGV